MNEKISIIIPHYNQMEYLPQAIGSVLQQKDIEDFEIIVVDDGSDIQDFDLIEMISRIDPRVHLVFHKENKGIADARNTGIKHSKGDWIAFLSADDYWELNFLKETLNAAELTNRKIIYTDYFKINQGGEKLGWFQENHFKKHIDMVVHAWNRCCVNLSGMLIARECFDKIGLFEPGMRYGEDYLWLLKSLKHYEYYHIQKPLLNYRIHEGQTTQKLLSKIPNNDKRLKEIAKRYWEEEV